MLGAHLRAYSKGIVAGRTHDGYFSIDKKTKRLVDPETGKKSTETDDADAYDLILRDKERLLSFAEPVRFIFFASVLPERGSGGVFSHVARARSA